MQAIVILGAAVWPDGPSPTLRRRAAHGARLWQADPDQVVLVCGGLGDHPPTEAEAMRILLRRDGVPDSAITLEDRSMTTGENLRFAKPILDRSGIARVVIVTDWYHAPRARLIARRLGLKATTSSPGLQGTRPLVQLRGALREIPAFLAYALRLKG